MQESVSRHYKKVGYKLWARLGSPATPLGVSASPDTSKSSISKASELKAEVLQFSMDECHFYLT